MDIKSFTWGLCAGVGLIILRTLTEKKAKPKSKIDFENKIDCLFFAPKVGIWNDCKCDWNSHCDVLSCPKCNYNKLQRLIASARSSIYVCMYVITLEELSTLLLIRFQEGIDLRIITDKQINEESSRSKLHLFLREHVPVKIIKTGEMMHNKFVIVDKKLVITGSLNWTKQGVTGNFENAVAIYNTEITQKFFNYFEELWDTSSLF